MGTKHRHYDVIVAWAAGEEIQYFWGFQWCDWEETSCPSFAGTAEWRIKPKLTKKEGWIVPICSGQYAVFPTNEMAARSIKHRKDLKPIHIEWEEEE